MPTKLIIFGQHAHLASPEEIAHGIRAAEEFFASKNADPAACLAALQKLKRDELITKEEALQCVIWDNAEEAAFRAVTVGWLSRDVDVQLGIEEAAAVQGAA